MVILFGSPGAGKSVQGQILAARRGWRWLSTGQLLRDAHDMELHKVMSKGELVKDETINNLIGNALDHAKDIDTVILDGFPRKSEQVKWLMDNSERFDRNISAVIILKVSNDVLYERLRIRGRSDDTPENIAKRTKEYEEITKPVIEFLKSRKVCIKEVDGEGTVGEVHDKIEQAVQSCLQR